MKWEEMGAINDKSYVSAYMIPKKAVVVLNVEKVVGCVEWPTIAPNAEK